MFSSISAALYYVTGTSTISIVRGRRNGSSHPLCPIFFLKCASVRNFVHYNSLDLRMNTVFANGIGESLFLCKLVFFPYHPRYSALLINTNWEIRVKSIVDVLGFYTFRVFTLDFTMPGAKSSQSFFYSCVEAMHYISNKIVQT